MLKNKWIDLIIIFLLGIVIFTISYKVTPNIGTISYNDSAHFWNAQNKIDGLVSSYSSDYMGISLLNGIFLYTPKGIIILILKGIGLNDSWIAYLLSFGFIFLVSCVTYFIFSKLSKSKLFGLFSAIFILFNNISIEYIEFGQYYYYLYILILILFFKKMYSISQSKKITFWDCVTLGLSSILIILPINLFAYCLLLLICFTYFYVSFGYRINLFYKLFLIGFIILLVNSYWIIPFFIGIINTNANDLYGGNASGVLDGFSKMASYINIISFRQYFNLISQKLFDSSLVDVYYLCLVGLVFGLVFFRNVGSKKFLILLLSIYLLFFNFSLGPNSLITGDLYQYLWDNYGFFHFFRSFTRFSAPLLIIILFILGINFSFIKTSRKKLITTVLLIGVVISMHYPLLSGNLKDTIIAIRIPNEYMELNRLLKNNQTIISYPNVPYETYHWSIGKSNLFIQDYFLKEYIINSPVIYNRASLNLEQRNGVYAKIFSNESSITNDLLSELKRNSIQYVLIQKNLLNIVNGKNVDYRKYTEYFQTRSKIILDNDEFTLFDLGLVSSKISTDTADTYFIRKASYDYDINIRNINSISKLSFLENYNSYFNLYLEPYNPIICTNENGECPSSNMFYVNGTFLKAWKTPIFENTHKMIDGYANSWTIDPDYIKKNYSKEYYKENSDGSIDVRMSLYFRPQSYFYLGLMISGFTLFSCSLYLIIASIRRGGKNLYIKR